MTTLQIGVIRIWDTFGYKDNTQIQGPLNWVLTFQRICFRLYLKYLSMVRSYPIWYECKLIATYETEPL